MTVKEQDTLLAQLLDDAPETANTDGNTWTVNDHRLPALNASQRITISLLLGFVEVDEQRVIQKVYDLLSPLHYEQEFIIGTDGYSLIFEDFPMVAENAYIDSDIEVSGAIRPCIRHKADMNIWSRNYFVRGTNLLPSVKFKNNRVYVTIDDGYYPVPMKFRYIRVAKTLTLADDTDYNTSTCELYPGMHDLIVIGAEKICRRVNTNFEFVRVIDQEYNNLLYSFIIGELTAKSEKK